MNYHLHKNEKGLTTVFIIILAVVILGGLGYVGWMVMNKDKNTTTSMTKAESDALKVSEKACLKEMNDKDLCKFFSDWSLNKKFAITSTDTTGGKTTTSEMKIDGTSTYMKITGEMAYEVISIGNDTYTKSGTTWYKQTTKPTATDTTPKVDTSQYKFDAPKSTTPAVDQPKYVKVGKEACGKFTCFKYKIVDPGSAGTTQYIWFDDSQYLTRKTSSVSADGTASTQVYSYDNVSVKVPSPVKVLGADQYIMPGQAEPQTMPSAADFTAPTQ